MGPPKSKNLAALQSKSRFCEGSMNDRTSAVPPVHFLGPEALAALEQPVESVRSSVQSAAGSTSSSNRLSGSKLLGQVWDGLFRGKLRLRKDTASASGDEADDGNANPATTATTATPTANEHMTRSKTAQNGTGFASREEVMANYQQLVAEGFFKSKAIHSSRQPGPPPRGPAPNPPPEALARRQSTTSSPGKAAAQQGTQQWPLAPADTPAPTHSTADIHSPASASSRGTKRAAANDDDEDEAEADEANEQYRDSTTAEDKENQPPPQPIKETQPKKRLRTIASRDGIFMPKLRSAASRRNMVGSSNRRSISASATTSNASTSTTNKLTKRQPQPNSTLSSSGSTTTTARGMFDMPANYQPRHGVSRPTLRNVSSGNGEGGEMRVLRSQRSLDGRLAPLSVAPDANRGIPSVPAIPPKFTYGEDRDNGAPWRGLRIR